MEESELKKLIARMQACGDHARINVLESIAVHMFANLHLRMEDEKYTNMVKELLSVLLKVVQEKTPPSESTGEESCCYLVDFLDLATEYRRGLSNKRYAQPKH